jgi:hypothetical protein
VPPCVLNESTQSSFFPFVVALRLLKPYSTNNTKPANTISTIFPFISIPKPCHTTKHNTHTHTHTFAFASSSPSPLPPFSTNSEQDLVFLRGGHGVDHDPPVVGGGGEEEGVGGRPC